MLVEVVAKYGAGKDYNFDTVCDIAAKIRDGKLLLSISTSATLRGSPSTACRARR